VLLFRSASAVLVSDIYLLWSEQRQAFEAASPCNGGGYAGEALADMYAHRYLVKARAWRIDRSRYAAGSLKITPPIKWSD
jgi:hypothetical protein